MHTAAVDVFKCSRGVKLQKWWILGAARATHSEETVLDFTRTGNHKLVACESFLHVFCVVSFAVLREELEPGRRKVQFWRLSGLEHGLAAKDTKPLKR